MNKYFISISAGILLSAIGATQLNAQFVTTTQSQQWKVQASPKAGAAIKADSTLIIDLSKTDQTIEGFGTCFNELGWTSLSLLPEKERDGILKEMFAPDVGANFTVCRMPVAANDFALEYYSYDDTEGDFAMNNFSISHDKATLIPFIKAAKKYQPNLKVWASPWTPPAWMKWNKHYACASTAAMKQRMEQMMKRMEQNRKPGQAAPSLPGMLSVDNGLAIDKQINEGTDGFIQESQYLKAYALYFQKFIKAYRAEGIEIFGVMPQNEFNSNTLYPGCCWKAGSLANFIGKYLGPAMQEIGVKTMFGTVERAKEAMVDTVLTDSDAQKYVSAVSFQWAGRGALPGIHQRYPNMKLIQSEQECGNGKNDWAAMMHCWELMHHYLNNGVSIYDYWNTSLLEGGVSHWGWSQNSLVTVAKDGKSFKYTLEYYLLKHASHFVLPGAKRLVTAGDCKDVICFVNKDGKVAVLIANEADADKTVSIQLGKKSYSPVIKAHSVNTIIL